MAGLISHDDVMVTAIAPISDVLLLCSISTMDVREKKVLLSSDRRGRVAIAVRNDGLFCLYEHWRWTTDMQRAAHIEPVQDDRWTTAYDGALYVDVEPLPGIYGTVAEAEVEAALAWVG